MLLWMQQLDMFMVSPYSDTNNLPWRYVRLQRGLGRATSYYR